MILIFSDGRGGGTWLMEMMAKASNGITVFEPFSENNFGYKRRLDDIDYPFLPKNDEQFQRTRHFFNDILSLKNPGVKALQFNSSKAITCADTAVVKFVNKNLILPWILKSYNFDRKPILLLRNPISIINSRANYGFPDMETEKTANVEDFWKLSPDSPLRREFDYLSTLRTNYELYLAEWCISSKPFLTSSEYNNLLHIVHYEDMKDNPAETINTIIHEYGFKGDFLINSDKESASTTRIRQVKAENNYLPNKEQRFREIFTKYGLEEYFESRVSSKL